MFADGSNTDFHLIPLAEDMEDCDVEVEYSYIVNSTILTLHTVEKLVRNFNGNNKDPIR